MSWSVVPCQSSCRLGEFKVIANGAAAEYGRGGSQVVVVSKSGTNEVHGSLFAFNRNRALSAKHVFATHLPKPSFNRNESGSSVGGPIIRDKRFYFGNFEGLRRRVSSTTVQSIFLNALSPAQMRANEGSAHANMSILGSAQLRYRSDKREFGTLKQLGDDQMISEGVASGLKSGYRFDTQPGKDKTAEFAATGSPVELGKDWDKFFFIDATQIIRCSSTGPATVSSDPCK